jgi:hypothetical protein
MRAKLRKLVKIVAAQADDTLNNENIGWYLNQLAKNGFNVKKYPDSVVPVVEPEPFVAKPVKIKEEKKPIKPKLKKTKPVKIKEEKKPIKPPAVAQAVPPKEEKKWISLKDLSYKELRAMGKKEQIKNSYRLKKAALIKLLEEKINNV